MPTAHALSYDGFQLCQKAQRKQPWLPESRVFDRVLKPDHRATDRTNTGTSMLLDRRCIEDGWNAGDPVVYGSALPPHIEPTAVALLGLHGMPSAETVRSVDWLYRAAERQSSIEALSWSD